MDSCLFCKIAEGTIPSKKVLESDSWLAFHDIAPQAPIHVLIIPKVHIASNNDIEENHQQLIGSLLVAAKRVANKLGVAEKGYRLVFNCGEHGGQAVSHLHLHLLAGRHLAWPPG